MSLNCLSCQLLQRSDSDREQEVDYYADEFDSPERSWSGSLRVENRGNSGFRVLAEKKVAPKGHRRIYSTGAVSFGKEPRLIRSSGMRRDWSFEDLRTIREDIKPSPNS